MPLLSSDDIETCHSPSASPEVEPDRSVLGTNHPEGWTELLNTEGKCEIVCTTPVPQI